MSNQGVAVVPKQKFGGVQMRHSHITAIEIGKRASSTQTDNMLLMTFNPVFVCVISTQIAIKHGLLG